MKAKRIVTYKESCLDEKTKKESHLDFLEDQLEKIIRKAYKIDDEIRNLVLAANNANSAVKHVKAEIQGIKKCS